MRGTERWRQGLAGLGLIITAYLTLQHYLQQVPLVCVQGGRVDCQAVLASPYAVWAGIPVTGWGFLWFAAVAWLAARRQPGWRKARRLCLAVGTLVVLYLIYVEFVVLGTVCLWCSALHAIILALMGGELWQAWQAEEPPAA